MYVDNKKRCRDLYSPCPKAHRESSRVVRTWAPQPYKDVHKEPLSAHQTSPCLILSYVICRPSSAPVSYIPTKSIRSLACSRALLRSPNSTFPCRYSIAPLHTHSHLKNSRLLLLLSRKMHLRKRSFM